MIVDGAHPDSLEALVLMQKHKAGAQLELQIKGLDTWFPRMYTDFGRPLNRSMFYRLAGEESD